MIGTVDLSGHWAGYYIQHDREQPIEADLSQWGDRLIGTMKDETTDFEASISEIAFRDGLPPGADEQIVARLRSACPDAPKGPVRAEVHVPSDSTLEGRVVGKAVRLLKKYQGMHFAGYRLGGMRVGVMGEGHEVFYQGILSPDGGEIDGKWSASDPNPPGLPAMRCEGSFFLKRIGPATGMAEDN